MRVRIEGTGLYCPVSVLATGVADADGRVVWEPGSELASMLERRPNGTPEGITPDEPGYLDMLRGYLWQSSTLALFIEP